MPAAQRNRLGRYDLLGELGRGAMGVVYKALDPQLDRTVAIKALRPDLGLAPELHGELTRRFYQEAVAAGRLNHPNIVAIHDVLELDGFPYIVLEYVEGQTLARLLAAEGPFPHRRAVQMALQVCAALDYAHARGIVHRDIKPANILVAGGDQVKVSDFGIAHIAGSQLTQTGAMLGSPAYMSPEQIRGRTVDGRSDLFSLGVVLYQALTGAEAFPGENPTTVLYRILEEEPVPIPERNPSVPAVLGPVMQRVLAKDPDQRYPTARDFADALRQALGPEEATAFTRKHATVVLGRPLGWRRNGLAAIGAASLLVAAAGGAVFWHRASEPPQRGSAQSLPAAGAAGPTMAPSAASGVVPPRGGEPTPDEASDPPQGPHTRAAGAEAQERAPLPARGGRRQAAKAPGGGRTGRPAPLRPPVATAARGSIRVATNPAVDVYLDGEPKGRAGAEPFLIAGVPAGQRLVVLRLGGAEQRFLRAVAGGETLSLTYYFPAGPREGGEERPRAPAAAARGEAWGCLSVNALPFGGIYVDGAYVGEAPKACLRVAAGERRIHFEANGQRSPDRIVHMTDQHTAEHPLTIGFDFRARRYLER